MLTDTASPVDMQDFGRPVMTEHADAIRRLGKQTIENVVEIGRRLTECKRICGHGNWLPWLEREFGSTEMTATRFINVYEMSKSNKLLDLDLPISAIYLLATPSTPEAAKIEIVERAQAGEPLPVAEIKHLVQKHRANGKAHKQPSKKKNSALKRLEAFMDAISFVESICTATSEMEVPTLDKQRGSEAIAQLREAVAALNVLCNEVARKSVESE